MIGPLVVCGVLVLSDRIDELEQIGVRDSKVLSVSRRTELADKIREIAEQIALRQISASEIDDLRGKGISLNDVEADSFASIVTELKPRRVYMDAADVNADRFGRTVMERSGISAIECEFIAEHKADTKYSVVSAASIIAKVTRDNEIKRLHRIHGDFGSGYPNDPKTVAFVRKLVETGSVLPDIIRQSWKSVERIISEHNSQQTVLSDY